MRLVKVLIFIGLIFLCEISVGQINDQREVPISERLINSTVKIESVGEAIRDGKIVPFSSIGTGFYYLIQVDSVTTVPVLVTNLHVIKNTIMSKMVFSLKDSLQHPLKGKQFEYNNFNFENRWIPHPKYDLAVLPLLSIDRKIYNDVKLNINFMSFDESSIPNDSILNKLSAIESLLMIGYPKGYWDSKNNYPIVRRGTTATPVFSDFDGKSEFLLDIPIYSGSSGSPIVLFNEGMYSQGNNFITGSRIYLLGIATQSIDLKPQANTSNIDNPLNIAVIIKASALNDFKNIFSDLIKQIEKQKVIK